MRLIERITGAVLYKSYFLGAIIWPLVNDGAKEKREVLVMSELIGPMHQKSLDEILARELRDTAKSIVQVKNTGH